MIELKRANGDEHVLTIQVVMDQEQVDALIANEEGQGLFDYLYNEDFEPTVEFIDSPARGARVLNLNNNQEEAGPAELRFPDPPAGVAGVAWWADKPVRDARFAPAEVR